jgi:hypothetical protein
MNKKTIMFIVLAVSLSTLMGCSGGGGAVTRADLEKVSQSCKAMNQVTADKAAECCKKNSEATNRLFLKLMKK